MIHAHAPSRRAATILIALVVTATLVVGCGTDYEPPAEDAGGRTPAGADVRESPAPETVAGAATARSGDIDRAGDAGLFVGPIHGIEETVVPSPIVVPSEDPHADYLEAESLYQRGERADAIPLLEASIAARSDFAPAHYLLGLCRRKVGELDGAEAALREALRLRPTHLRARVNLARVLIDDQRPGEALEALAMAGTDSLVSDDLHNVRGLALMDVGDLDGAESAFLAAVDANPENVYALNNLGLCRIRTGRFEEAIAPLEDAAAHRAAPAYVFNNLGIARERVGALEAAAESYALAIEAGHAAAPISLARVQERIDHLARTGAGEDADVATTGADTTAVTVTAPPDDDATGEATLAAVPGTPEHRAPSGEPGAPERKE